MSEKKRTADIYLKVIAGAFVTIPDKAADPMSQRMLVKVRTDVGTEDLIGLLFNDPQSVDSCLSALHRIKTEFEQFQKIHPKLKEPINGDSH